MQITIEPTQQWIIEGGLPIRVWRVVREGEASPVLVFVIGCAVPVDSGLAPEFERELVELCSPGRGDQCS